jgi:REP element-mobilizing transposase RayT
MIIAFHSILTAYGFWLPNEPRGSWSDFVASWELRKFGPATKVTTRRSIAAKPFDRALKAQMQSALQHEPVHFTGEQSRLIGQAFANAPYTIHACAVLPEHVHLVIAHTPRRIRTVVGHLKSEATRLLREHGFFPEHTPWADHGWNVFLDAVKDVKRAIAYVENNPIREGKPRQRWHCVVPFDPATARGGAI